MGWFVCTCWYTRARALDINPQSAKGQRDAEAYMNGVNQTLVGLGLMSKDRSSQIAFMTAIGRLPQYMLAQAAKYDGS